MNKKTFSQLLWGAVLFVSLAFFFSCTGEDVVSPAESGDEISLPEVESATSSDNMRFGTNWTGQNKSMTTWAIGWVGNTAQNVSRMGGAGQIDYLRVGCPKEWALVNGTDLSSSAISEMDKQLAKADKVPNAKIGCVCSGGNGINSWYVQSNGKDIRGSRWLALFRAMKKHIESKGKQVAFIEVGNEQDFGGKKGSPANINSIQQRFQSDSEMGNIPLVGPSPLSAGNAKKEYDVTKSTTDWGATHAINGSGQKYIDFVKQVRGDNKPYWGSEIHNLVEMIIGAQYGALGGLWWSPVKVQEGLFSQYNSRGNRVGYKEVSSTFSAAAAYKDNTQSNTIHIFVASKFGGQTFTLKCADRDVSYDGSSLKRDHTVTLTQNESRYIKVTW